MNQMGDVPEDLYQKMFDQQNGKCYYCKMSLKRDYHTEHKTPLCRGGLHDKDNLCLSCPECNLRKNRRTEEEFFALINGENNGEKRTVAVYGQTTFPHSKM